MRTNPATNTAGSRITLEQTMHQQITEAEFLEVLTKIEDEVHTAFTLYYQNLELHHLSRTDKKLYSAINAHAGFWIAYDAATFHAMIMALSRLLDHAGDAHTIHKLLRLLRANGPLFSKTKLRARKSGGGNPEWLDAYMEKAWEPQGPAALRHLSDELKPHAAKFLQIYKPIRDRILAHNLILNDRETFVLYERTNTKELGEITNFLYQLVLAIRGLYYNGNKPIPFNEEVDLHAEREREKIAKVIRKLALVTTDLST